MTPVSKWWLNYIALIRMADSWNECRCEFLFQNLPPQCLLSPQISSSKHLQRELWWKWKSLSPVGLCNPMEDTVHGIFQARIQEWVAIPFSRASSQPRGQTWFPCIAGRFFTVWAMREVQRRELPEEHSGSLSGFSSGFCCSFGTCFLC